MKKFIYLAVAALAVTCMASCSADNEEEIRSTEEISMDFLLNYSNKSEGISWNVFREKAVGSAWRNYREYTIDKASGKASEKDILGRDGFSDDCVMGHAPKHMYIGADNLYFIAPGELSEKLNIGSGSKYTYNEGNNTLVWPTMMGSKPFSVTNCIIESLDDNTLTTMQCVGIQDEGLAYRRIVYVKMTDEEFIEMSATNGFEMPR
ncbi:MAG: hypothetical protein Q4D23_07990 [Bacteroidales bacterium]|nr:hypothetical protein [Bacteroidales bacterium]